MSTREDEPMPNTSAAPWARVAADTDVADECAVRVRVGDVPVCLARSRGRLHAIVDRCTYEDMPPSEGDVDTESLSATSTAPGAT